MPQWRANANVGYSDDHHSANVFLRYIDGYTDDQNAVEIPSYTTLDLQYTYSLGDPDEAPTRFSIGVINAFNKQVPIVATNGGFDSKVHDPRQRMIYGRISKRF
jgi:iron complex outermembrane recepter protein